MAKNNEPMISAGLKALYEVLNRPKNQEKPPFGGDLKELFHLASLEIIELSVELNLPPLDLEAIKYEAADACAFLFAIIAECDRRLLNAGNGGKL